SSARDRRAPRDILLPHPEPGARGGRGRGPPLHRALPSVASVREPRVRGGARGRAAPHREVLPARSLVARDDPRRARLPGRPGGRRGAGGGAARPRHRRDARRGRGNPPRRVSPARLAAAPPAAPAHPSPPGPGLPRADVPAARSRRPARLPPPPPRPGPPAPRPRPARGRGPGARGPPRGVRALPRVRPLDPRPLRAVEGAAHRLHVRLDRTAVGRSRVPPVLPELPGPSLLDAGVRGAGGDQRGARSTGTLGYVTVYDADMERIDARRHGRRGVVKTSPAPPAASGPDPLIDEPVIEHAPGVRDEQVDEHEPVVPPADPEPEFAARGPPPTPAPPRPP